MSEVPSNQWPVNRAALKWLQEAKASPEPSMSYLAQLAYWGLEEGGVTIPRPMSPSQPDPHNVEYAIHALLKYGSEEAEHASRWFLSSPDLEEEEQAASLAWHLEQAESPSEAAQIVMETAYDLFVAWSDTGPE